MKAIQRLFVLVAVFLLANTARLYAVCTTQPAAPIGIAASALDLSAAHRFSLDADDDDDKPAPPASSRPGAGRYFFNLLDNRSSYGKDFFHDPLIGPEFDAEQQIDLDYAHGEGRGLREDELDAGFQWNVAGQLSIAGQFGWSSESQSGLSGGSDDEHGSARGLDSLDLAAYHPLFQYVSNDGFLDYSAVARLDIGIPTRTAVSGRNAQLTPYLGQLLRIGNQVSAEGWIGTQFNIAPHETNQFIYGTSIGYAVPHEQAALPFTDKITPIIELDGQTPLSSAGQDALFGGAGFDLSLKSPGELHPHVEIGYQIPIDAGAREQMRWGIVTSVFIEF